MGGPGLSYLLAAGMHPLQAFPELFGRPVDFGLGYMLREGGAHGPWADFGLNLLAFAPGTPARSAASAPSADRLVPTAGRAPCMAVGWCFRLWLRTQARMHFYPEASRGPIAGWSDALRLQVELARFANGTRASADSRRPLMALGAAWRGENAFGVFLEAEGGQLWGVAYWGVRLGLSIRIPASAGAGILCCAIP